MTLNRTNCTTLELLEAILQKCDSVKFYAAQDGTVYAEICHPDRTSSDVNSDLGLEYLLNKVYDSL